MHRGFVAAIAIVAILAGGSMVAAGYPSPQENRGVTTEATDHMDAATELTEAKTRVGVADAAMRERMSKANSSEERKDAVQWRLELLRDRAGEVYESHHRLIEEYEEGEISAERYTYRVAVMSERARILSESLKKTRGQGSVGEATVVRGWQASGRLDVLANRHTELLWKSVNSDERMVTVLTREGGVPRMLIGDEGGSVVTIQIRPPVVGPYHPVEHADVRGVAESELEGDGWVLMDTSVRIHEGVYEYVYVQEGERSDEWARLVVEATTGRVVKLVQMGGSEPAEVQATDGNNISIVAVNGTVQRGKWMQVAVLEGGNRTNATIYIDGERVGNVTPESTQPVVLPRDAETLRAETPRGNETWRFEWPFERDESNVR